MSDSAVLRQRRHSLELFIQLHREALAADGKHVDLYGYTSLAIATIQEQQAQIDALEVRLKALEAQCK